MVPTLSRILAPVAALFVVAAPAWGESTTHDDAASDRPPVEILIVNTQSQRIQVVHASTPVQSANAKASAREAGLPIIGPTASHFDELQARPATRWGLYKPTARKSRTFERFPGFD